jgi:4-amino-4-deoxy-L-arabinose transferase-like glycosyltransferase
MARPPAPVAMIGFYAALAFGIFAKGPVGLFPALVALIWLLTEHGARGFRRLWHLPGLAVFALVTLAWLVPFLAAGTQTFGENVLWQDWMATYLGPPLPRRVWSFVLDALVGFLPWTPALVIGLWWALRDRADSAVRFALLSFAVPFLVIILSHSRLPRYLLPVYPGAALVVGWWADAHGATHSRLGRLLGWAALIGVVGALCALPWIPDARESGLVLNLNALWKALPLLVAVILIAAVFAIGFARARPALLVYGGVALMSLGLGYGAWLFNGITDRREDFRQLAATLARHAAGGDLRVFTQAKLLPLDFYAGRELPRLANVDELKRYVGASARPTVLIDRQNLRVVPAQLVGELRVLDTLGIHEQRLYVLGCNAAERGAGSPRCASAGSLESGQR